MTSRAGPPAPAAGDPPALELDDLRVAYRVRGIDRTVLRGVSLSIAPGESYGLVGESGCGKSTAAFAAMRYLPRNGQVVGGTVRVDGQDLLALGGSAVRAMRGGKVAMVYQNPVAALNPAIRIGDQLAELFRLGGASKSDALTRTADALRAVRIADPAQVMRRYPHQLSGGMAQRVVIAMALAGDPRLLILDEPTTGLDATVEAEVLDLIRVLRAETGTAVLFISHNLGVIRSMCDRVGVLYAGRLVEEGTASDVLHDPRHPYTVGLLRCIPRAGLRKDRDRLDTIPGTLPPLGAVLPGCVYADRCPIVQDTCREAEPPLIGSGDGHVSRCWFPDRAPSLPRSSEVAAAAADGHDPGPAPATGRGEPLLTLDHLAKTFGNDGQQVRVLSDIALELRRGETLGLVGESGSGKTTLARVVLGLLAPDQGGIVALEGHHLGSTLATRKPAEVGAVQIVFQNPDSALNRRHAVRRIVGRAVTKLGRRGRPVAGTTEDLLTRVRVDARLFAAKPSQLSGGLKQRVAIARAFAGDPKLVVCDEPTSALDVSVQAAILNLLVDLQAREHVAYLFISHDLGVVRYLADRIAVLYLGRVMEVGPAEAVFDGPHHPYTEALVSSVPSLDEVGGDGNDGQSVRVRVRLHGEVPSVAAPPAGCVLHPRCPRRAGSGVEELCDSVEPELVEVAPGHQMRCHIPFDRLRTLQSTSLPEEEAVLVVHS